MLSGVGVGMVVIMVSCASVVPTADPNAKAEHADMNTPAHVQ